MAELCRVTSEEDVAQFIAREPIQFCVVGVEFGAQLGAALFVPNKWGNREWGIGSRNAGVENRQSGVVFPESRFPTAYCL